MVAACQCLQVFYSLDMNHKYLIIGLLLSLPWSSAAQATCLDRVLETRDRIEADVTGRLDENARARLEGLLLGLCDPQVLGQAGDTMLETDDRRVHTTRGLKRPRTDDGLYVDEAPFFFGVEVEGAEIDRPASDR